MGAKGRYILADAGVHKLWFWSFLEEALGTGGTASDAGRIVGTFTAHFLRDSCEEGSV